MRLSGSPPPVCGSDLWDYRGINPVTRPAPIGHEYCGIVEEAGSQVRSIKPGQFVGGAQADYLRVPLADGTLVATPEPPAEDLVPSLLTLSDVMGTGWFAAVSANVRPL
jgi:threonine dehydrogenase-like Zn-dependent dehydrogenase